MSEDASGGIILEGNEISLSDLLGANLLDVVEVRFENLPIGAYQFQIEKIEPTTMEVAKEKGSEEKIKIGVIKLVVEVAEVYGVVDVSLNKDDLIGKKHTQNYLLRDREQLGRLKAFIVDTGYVCGEQTLQEIMQGMQGMKFDARIGHAKNKDNPDIVYANLNKVTPVKPAA